jgi:uncharacterized protein YjdB
VLAIAAFGAGCAEPPGREPLTRVDVAGPPARAAVERVDVDAPATRLVVGGQVTLVATPRGPSGAPVAGRSVVWTSTDPAVVAVDSAGAATAVAPGTATIAALVEGRSGQLGLTVAPVRAAAVRLTPDSATLRVGGPRAFGAAVLDAAGAPLIGRRVEWSSSAPEIAAVGEDGVVRPLAPGRTTITAAAEGIAATAAVTITPVPVAGVVIDLSGLSAVYVGDVLPLRATPVDSAGTPLAGRALVYGSSAPAVASVSASGEVSALAPGAVRLTVTSEGSGATHDVAVTGVRVAFDTPSGGCLTVATGATCGVVAKVRAAGSNNLVRGRYADRITSSAPGIAEVRMVPGTLGGSPETVRAYGEVRGVSPGTATLTAAYTGANGVTVTDTFRVTVVP